MRTTIVIMTVDSAALANTDGVTNSTIVHDDIRSAETQARNAGISRSSLGITRLFRIPLKKNSLEFYELETGERIRKENNRNDGECGRTNVLKRKIQLTNSTMSFLMATTELVSIEETANVEIEWKLKQVACERTKSKSHNRNYHFYCTFTLLNLVNECFC